MYKKKYNIVSGVVCLAINIVLPTLIFNYYLQIKGLCETMFNYAELQPIAYGLLFILSLLWLGSMFIALRELGGYVLQLGDYNYEDNCRC